MTIPSELLEMADTYRLLAELSPDQLRKLIPLVQEKEFASGEIIFREGQQSAFLYLIASGDVALETTAGGAPTTVQKLSRGDTMGWSALTSESTTHFQARALTYVTVIALPGDRIRHACDADPALGYELMKRLLELVTERLDATRLQIAAK
jgi:CRP/FNR family transcriptional regulator, cyclic AMP receptor protein